MMRFVDGFELCRRLRNNELTSHIPIIMLTTRADWQSKMEGLNQGADAYLEKPFNREELLLRIQKLLELRRTLQHHYLKNTGLKTHTDTAREAVMIETLQAKHEIEDEFVRKVRLSIEKHLDDAGFMVEQLCKEMFMSHSQLHRNWMHLPASPRTNLSIPSG